MKMTKVMMTMSLAFAFVLATMPMANAAVFSRADHNQDCYDGGSLVTDITPTTSEDHWDLCLYAGVTWYAGINVIDTDHWISQPLGMTSVAFTVIAVFLADGHACADEDNDEDGEVLDLQCGNDFSNQVHFNLPGSCTAQDNATVPADVMLRSNYRSALPLLNPPHDDPLRYSNAVPPYWVGQFIEFAYPSVLSGLTVEVHAEASEFPALGCDGVTDFGNTNTTVSIGAIAGLRDSVYFGGVDL